MSIHNRIPQHFIDDLVARIDIVDLVDSYVPLRKKGASYSACCPFHNEKTPSFHVTQTKQLYHCFGCGVGGNAISFVMAYENLNFMEALTVLAARAGVELPKGTQIQTTKSPTLSLYPLLDEVAQSFQANLKKTQLAIDYLKHRGISGQTAKAFRLGYVKNEWDGVIKAFAPRYGMDALKEAGLVIKKEQGGFYDRFRGRIIFPISDSQGRIIAFGGRILDEGEPKYLNSPETPLFHKGKELYGLYEARKTCHTLANIWVVEGYLDCILLAQFGIANVVATLGTAITTTHLQHLFRVTSEIIFCFDGDTAGEQAAWRALEILLPLMQDDYRVKFVLLPHGEDPDSYVQKIGKDAFLAMKAQTLTEFFFGKLTQQIPMQTPEGRAKLAKQANDYLQKIPGQFLRQIMFDQLARLVRIDVNRFSARDQPVSRHVAYRHPTRQRLAKHSPVRVAVMLLLQYPHLASEISLPNDLRTLNLPGIPILFDLHEQLMHQPELTTAGLLEHWRDHSDAGVMQRLAIQTHCIPEAGILDELKGALLQLQKRFIEQKIDYLLQQGQLRTLTEDEKATLQQLIEHGHD